MKRFLCLLLVMAFLAPVALADVIIFKDGRHLECTVKGIFDNQAGVQENGKEYYIPMEKIDEIIYVKKIKEDDTMKWIMGASAVAMCILAFVLAAWGRNL